MPPEFTYENWMPGMAFRYRGDMHDELKGSIHYFVGWNPIYPTEPIFVRRPCEGALILHWLGYKDEYERAPAFDKILPLPHAYLGWDNPDGPTAA